MHGKAYRAERTRDRYVWKTKDASWKLGSLKVFVIEQREAAGEVIQV